jgi:hypothetical protein
MEEIDDIANKLLNWIHIELELLAKRVDSCWISASTEAGERGITRG